MNRTQLQNKVCYVFFRNSPDALNERNLLIIAEKDNYDDVGRPYSRIRRKGEFQFAL